MIKDSFFKCEYIVKFNIICLTETWIEKNQWENEKKCCTVILNGFTKQPPESTKKKEIEAGCAWDSRCS